MAVAWTDFIQGILMVTGAALAGIFALSFSGGLGGLSADIAQIPSIDSGFIISPFVSLPVIVLGISLFLGDGIISWIGQPTLMVRYMAAKSRKTLNLTGLLAVFIQSTLFFGTFLAALYMRTQFPTPDQLPMAGDTETVLIQFFALMIHPVFAGLFIGGLLAAIMSTADSMLLMGTSTIINDVYAKMINKQATEKQLLLYGRIITAVIAVIAVLMSLDRGPGVLWIAWFGWTTLGLFFTPVVLGLWWKRTTREGAIAGLIGGFIVLLFWNRLGLGEYIFQAFAAGVVALILTVVISLLTKEPPQEVIEELDEVHAMGRRKEQTEGVSLSQVLTREKLAELMPQS